MTNRTGLRCLAVLTFLDRPRPSAPSRGPVVVRNFFSRRAVAKGTTALLTIAALLTTSCNLGGSRGPSAKERADALVHELEAIPDAGQRAVAAAITLNAMCSIGRAASGTSDGPIEGALLAHYSALDPDVKQGVAAARDTVRAIPAAKRTALLGKLADLDPGSCDSAPNWPAIKVELQKAAFPVPRLRANYCSGGFTYADNTPADRAITSAHHSFGTFEGPLQVAAAAAPVILGVEGEHVTARHPALKATTTTPIQNGISPYGVETDIPCSVTNDSCDAAQGLICGQKFSGGGPHCVAFPVVQKDQDLVLRGYNFWDVTEAQLVLTPFLPGEGIESVTPVSFVDTNEPLDGNAACPPASATNPTHNRAHFRIGANEGHFYRVRVFNHNGTFRTEQDAQADAPPRDVHVCYPAGLGSADVPPGTIRDCVAPPETCPQDGAACSGTWTTPPRKVADCRHLPNQPPVCGETPEWFGNEQLTTRTDAVPPVLQDAVVFVIGDEPKFEIRATLDAIECKDETGSTNIGSDEPLMLVAGFPLTIPSGAAEELLDKIDQNSSAFRGGNFDHGDREHPKKILSTVTDVGFDDRVVYLVALYEDDEFLIGLLVGIVIIASIAAIIALSGGTAAAVLGAAGGAALAGVAWTAIMASVSGSDLIGRTTLEVDLTKIEERIGADHTPNFLTAPHAFGALPALANAPVEKERADPALIHPFVDARLGPPLQAKCEPAACPTPQTCLVNQCVDPGFVDPTAGRGFKERREFFGSSGYYAVDLLWEKVPAH